MSDDQTQFEYPEAALSLSVGKPGNGLVILFFKFGDQFRHRVEWAMDGQAFPLLQTFRWNEPVGKNVSIGGPIAPSQEVVKEVHGDKNVVMSIGRSGKSHWSASYQADPNINRDANKQACSILIEHACRLNDEEIELGCGFWLGDVAASMADDNVNLDGDGHKWSLRPLNGTTFQLDNEQAILIARPTSVDPKRPTTVTWGWRIGKRET